MIAEGPRRCLPPCEDGRGPEPKPNLPVVERARETGAFIRQAFELARVLDVCSGYGRHSLELVCTGSGWATTGSTTRGSTGASWYCTSPIGVRPTGAPPNTPLIDVSLIRLDSPARR